MQDYRKLRVWPKSFALAVAVRRTVERFPPQGYADLKAQMQSAAESIYFNIMEGCGADTSKDFARFLSVSIKSSSELEGQLELAHAYGIIASRRWQLLSSETIGTRKMLFNLRRRVLQAGPALSKDSIPEHPQPTTRNKSDRRSPQAHHETKAGDQHPDRPPPSL